ncbi:hypothetical protein EPUS_01638 [Endocarpon pusillum Z07020]|uniref:Heterokaryon incompatibility domain-containing protein n=1 Tax=Endocarpon pusillum (strain Z07020 / HMAS-L-300199) TaxID=1263415 RepID=U1GTR3_ENDPU|nr:uncharacterized protein EPUS_01638 [Endocarpon pusillum Z07020]ERF75808.1 hypothetical protein EPUS_01638 [Endocarpon pusillum Z07020]
MLNLVTESKFRRHFSYRNLPPATSSLSSLGVAYSWYLACRAMHKACRRLQRGSNWYPTRLLDVGVPGDLKWKLHICAEDDLFSPNYMTISYRWGSLPSLTLVQSNINELRRGKLTEELPQTFRDAIIVLHRFSIRYLWIDSLCIIQDSLEDWEKESSMMRDVYANSCCNISATASSEPLGGLFRNHQKGPIQPGVVAMNIGPVQKKYYILDSSYWDRQVLNTVLNQRGWVFQERLLAPRVLHFASHQILFECFSDQKCEAFVQGIPWQNSLKSFEAIFIPTPQEQNIMSDAAFDLWINLVELYTRCDLTKPDDRLAAFSGLAHLFQDTNGDDYLSGIWRSRLLESLYWEAERPMRRALGVYIAPSWSWACGNGPIKWNRPQRGYTRLSSVLDARTQNASSDCTGRVVGGSIRVRGLLLRATCEDSVTRGRPCVLALKSKPTLTNNRATFTNETEPPLPALVHFSNDSPYVISTLNEDFEDTNYGGDEDIYCLVLHAQSVIWEESFSDTFLEGVILKPVSPSSSESFVRTGTFRIRGRECAEKSGVRINIKDGSACLSETSQLTEITIV